MEASTETSLPPKRKEIPSSDKFEKDSMIAAQLERLIRMARNCLKLRKTSEMAQELDAQVDRLEHEITASVATIFGDLSLTGEEVEAETFLEPRVVMEAQVLEYMVVQARGRPPRHMHLNSLMEKEKAGAA